ncbi:MAG: hypothetical protein QGG45_02470 [Alphaproteobacteria bacterium]|nr:hypothetical protein [Alphaproteobacteria bacterium]
MFTFVVLSTVDTSDPFETFRSGDTLHRRDCIRFFPTETAAVYAGRQILRSGTWGPAYDRVRRGLSRPGSGPA